MQELSLAANVITIISLAVAIFFWRTGIIPFRRAIFIEIRPDGFCQISNQFYRPILVVEITQAILRNEDFHLENNSEVNLRQAIAETTQTTHPIANWNIQNLGLNRTLLPKEVRTIPESLTLGLVAGTTNLAIVFTRITYRRNYGIVNKLPKCIREILRFEWTLNYAYRFSNSLRPANNWIFIP